MCTLCLHAAVHAHLSLAVRTGVNHVLTPLHTERYQTAWPAPAIKTKPRGQNIHSLGRFLLAYSNHVLNLSAILISVVVRRKIKHAVQSQASLLQW